MKYSEKLYNRYVSELESGIDWNSVANDCRNYISVDDNDVVGYALIGSVIGLYPSGKIYAFWTTNQTARDVIRDQAFQEAIEHVAHEHGYFVTNGEGSSDDVFLATCFGDISEYPVYNGDAGPDWLLDGEEIDEPPSGTEYLYISDHGNAWLTIQD